MRATFPTAFLLTVVACAPEPVEPRPVDLSMSVATVSAPPTASAPQPMPASAQDELAKRFPSQTVTIVAPWKGARGTEDVVAVVLQEERPSNRGALFLSWFRATESGAVSEDRRYPLSQTGALRMSAADLDADGSNELLVFGNEPGMFGSVDAFKMRPGDGQPLAVGAAAAAMDGAQDLEEVKGRLPLGARLDDAKLSKLSTAALLGRTAFAATADLRRMLAAKVAYCDTSCDNFQKCQTSCKTITPSKLSDAELEKQLRWSFEAAFDPMVVMGFECKKDKTERCEAGRSGATHVIFEMEGEGAARRLSKIVHKDDGIGE